MDRRIGVGAARIARGLGVAAVLIVGALPAAAADADHGKQVFNACAACHTEKPQALGPSLKGVFGRKAAALDDFRYSNPMKRANLVWDEASLRDFISDPQSKVKGNRMPFGGLTKPEDIDDVVAFLKTYQ